jgi:hypothetical protein
VSDKKDDEFYHQVIDSYDHMLHLDDDYIVDDLVLGILDTVMYNPFNGSEGLDTNFDIDESDIELDEVQDQYDMDM